MFDEHKTNEILSTIFTKKQKNDAADTMFNKPYAELSNDEQEDLFYEITHYNEYTNYAFLLDNDDGAPDGKIVIGKYISYTSSDDSPDSTITKFCEVKEDKDYKKLAKMLNEDINNLVFATGAHCL